MENLLNCNCRKFSCYIRDNKAEGLIRVEDGEVFLCQNVNNGKNCKNKLGYAFSWNVSKGTREDLKENSVKDLIIKPAPKELIESYKDWQVGERVKNKSSESELEVIFRYGELVICKDMRGCATGNYTCDELYNEGYRLVVKEDLPVEVTIDEIAKWKGVDPSAIKVKK